MKLGNQFLGPEAEENLKDPTPGGGGDTKRLRGSSFSKNNSAREKKKRRKSNSSPVLKEDQKETARPAETNLGGETIVQRNF